MKLRNYVALALAIMYLCLVPTMFYLKSQRLDHEERAEQYRQEWQDLKERQCLTKMLLTANRVDSRLFNKTTAQLLLKNCL